MRRSILLICLLLPSVCLGAERFLLESELRTVYFEAASTQIFTGYTYDTDGNRVLERVFDGADSLEGPLMSTVRLERDGEGRCTEMLQTDRSGDTLSIVRREYAELGPVRVVVLRGDRSLRYTDSLLYESGLLAEKRRYDTDGNLTFFHRYCYDDGLLRADSLYQPDGGGGYVPVRARIVGRNFDGSVAEEATWRVSGGQWYHISTTLMTYEQKLLFGVATYETDASDRRLIDSLAYAYDSWGNRVLEEAFDDERTKTYDIVYTWVDMFPIGVGEHAAAGRRARPHYRNGRIVLGESFRGSVALCTPGGRILFSRCIAHQSTVVVPPGLAAGRYMVRTGGAGVHTTPITIYN